MAKRPVSTEYTVIDAKPVPPQPAPELRIDPKPEVLQHRAPPTKTPRRTARLALAIVVLLFLAALLVERLSNFTRQATIQAAIVQVTPGIAGKVIELGVVDDSVVKAGDLLFRIDPRPYEIAVRRAEAQLAQIGQATGASTSAVAVALAQLVEARVARDNRREQAQRAIELVRKNVSDNARQDDADAALKRAEAAVASAQADLDAAVEEWGPSGNGNPQLGDALITLEAARLDLAQTTVTAPSDGAVSGLRLAIGQFVTAGQPAMTLIDARTIWIGANIGEASLAHMVPGDRAEVVLGAFPGQVFPASVESIGSGVSRGGLDAATGLSSSNSDWPGGPQLVPLRIVFLDAMPGNIRYGSSAGVVVYTNDNPVQNALGWLWIRIISVLGYLG